MFSLKVSTGFKRLPVQLCLKKKTNCPTCSKPRGSLWRFCRDLNFGVQVCMCMCVCFFFLIVHRKSTRTLRSLSSHRFEVKSYTTAIARMWLPASQHPSCYILWLVSLWEFRSRESCFVLTYIPEPVLTNTRAGGLGASSRALARRRPTFCLVLTGNSSLKGGGGGGGASGEAGRRKDFSEHGNGPKGKHSSDSRCGNTLYTHTHTHRHTDRERRR